MPRWFEDAAWRESAAKATAAAILIVTVVVTANVLWRRVTALSVAASSLTGSLSVRAALRAATRLTPRPVQRPVGASRLGGPMAPARFLRDALARWVRDIRDGFWNGVDYLWFFRWMP